MGEHFDLSYLIVSRFNQVNLKLKPSSVNLGHSQLRALGHLVTEHGVGVDPLKLETINAWPFPETGKQMQSFLGIVGYCREPVRMFADLTAPLEAVKNDKMIVASPLLLDHFQLVKDALNRAPF